MRDEKLSKKFRKELEKNSYILVRTNGDHFIYKREGHTVSVPYGLNKMIEKRLRKEVISKFSIVF